MKYAFKVKHNGVWYAAGAEVPAGDAKPKVVEPKVEEEPKAGITKTDIARMSRTEVVKMAEENGIEVSDDMTARELKDEIIKKLEL